MRIGARGPLNWRARRSDRLVILPIATRATSASTSCLGSHDIASRRWMHGWPCACRSGRANSTRHCVPFRTFGRAPRASTFGRLCANRRRRARQEPLSSPLARYVLGLVGIERISSSVLSWLSSTPQGVLAAWEQVSRSFWEWLGESRRRRTVRKHAARVGTRSRSDAPRRAGCSRRRGRSNGPSARPLRSHRRRRNSATMPRVALAGGSAVSSAASTNRADAMVGELDARRSSIEVLIPLGSQGSSGRCSDVEGNRRSSVLADAGAALDFAGRTG
jgi:hypothetical protein